ncbi:helix-turn-helix domain-containing protein [Halococcus sp. PRR34]|uniref:helix-turn-helix domain-containing protein n=1 Tax=Halococcus sp. PRR34 TaxID=3020830 RepID=UPI002361EA60|nr:helix-turn-helix domain-containing protein [Halococcus sp. PRR34]
MARAENTELIDDFEEFYRNYYRNEIGELARQYPNEQRSLFIDWDDLYRFDSDLADDYRSQPGQLQEYAEEALRLYDLPVDVGLGRAHVRIRGLQENTEIREIRARHRGQLLSVQGTVQKATDVRPKITEAAFECQRCGTLTRIPQTGGDFQEPHECQGCERQGPFDINFDQSEFVDAQKIRVQESPEGLRGGETPQDIDVHIEDDITGKVTAGDHVRVTGVLHLDQQESGRESTAMFDVFMDGVSVEIEDEQFEDMDIDEADKRAIVDLSTADDIYEQMVASIAPSIYGYEQAKLAMTLQLFSGVAKHLPDGSRIRGDLHMLLIGDPGTGKCVKGDTSVTLADGSERPIRDVVESNLDAPTAIEDGVYDEVDLSLPTMGPDGTITEGRATKVWKREAPERMYRLRTTSGKEIEITPSHPLFVQSDGGFAARTAAKLDEGAFVATPRRVPTAGDDTLDVGYDLDDSPHNTNRDIVPDVGDELQRVRKALALSQFECGIARTTYQHYERGDRNPSRDSLLTVVEAFEERIEWLRTTEQRVEAGGWEDIESVRDELNVSQADLADEMDVEQTAVSYDERNDVVPDGGRTMAGKNAILERIASALDAVDSVARLRDLAENDVRWDRIVSIEELTPEYDWVYDLEVDDTHTYLSNGVVSHNSQLLQYIRQIAPRSVYTSGKGSSSAGLTASAVQDDFGEGQQWTLEAGALVLADQGIAAVDELDKMKCVTGDTLVHLGDRIARIRDIAHEAVRDGTIESLENSRSIRDVDLEAWTMTDDGRLVTRPVTAIHEYDAPESLVEVSLSTGERLSATADHPYFVFEDGERVEKAAADVESGDWVYVPRSIEAPATDGGTLSQRGDSNAVRRSFSDETPGQDGVSPSLGRVLGYLAGDGNLYYQRDAGVYGIQFTNTEEELLADFERACEGAFDAETVRPPSERREDGVETVRLCGREYADVVLEAGMNLETYDGKRVPEGVTEASRAAKAAFVRAFADSEGNVDGRMVKLCSASHQLLLGVKHLLLEFGISCQIQHRMREGKRDIYLLVITDADSLAAFDRQIGFTLDRKQTALTETVETVSGDRTILDVLPDCGAVLETCRTSLRLHQSECGIDDATYCDFENGDADISFRLARVVLEAFEDRKRRASLALDELDSAGWDDLERIRTTFHVSQSGLAKGTGFSQQQVSRRWGEDEGMKETVADRLRSVLGSVADTDLSRFTQLVDGDVKWRRVETVETVPATVDDDRIRLLEVDLADVLGCSTDEARERARAFRTDDPSPAGWDELRTVLERYGISMTAVADDLGVDQATVSRWFNGHVSTDEFETVRDAVLDRADIVRSAAVRKLEEIEERERPSVYDLTVDGTHNFVANGMIVHNSDDRSAMHEALEQQTISISKAGINATLQSRCSLLGAANPKYGRFDQYESIGEQIDLEPALISRFDLIFTVTDDPDPDRDRELAEHILRTNYAGELNTQRTEQTAANVSQAEVDAVTDTVAPAIEPDLLRKYVAYAQRNCFPTMTEEAKEAISDFYVDLRAEGADEDAPIPVTARKLEALVRLAEASARVRLADTVEIEDAERVIEVVRTQLQDIGVDPETGEFDADIVETGTSKTQRDRIKNVKALIAEIEEEYDAGAPIEEVLDRAEETGTERSKAEHELEKLRRQGEVYEPQTDHLRTT